MLLSKPTEAPNSNNSHYNKVASSGYHNYDGCRIPVKSGINVDFFRKKLLDYDNRIICELLEFGASVGFESNILEEPFFF
jgi:hypothetical protein